MSMIRWEPLSELASLRRAMDRFFEEPFLRPSRLLTFLEEGLHLPLEMYQTKNAVVVKAALPGVKPEDVDISISGDILTIKGEAKAEEEVKREDYLHQERRYGTFSRSVQLPGGLNADKAEAALENGVLTLSIPKAEEAKPRSIPIKAKGVIEGKK